MRATLADTAEPGRVPRGVDALDSTWSMPCYRRGAKQGVAASSAGLTKAAHAAVATHQVSSLPKFNVLSSLKSAATWFVLTAQSPARTVSRFPSWAFRPAIQRANTLARHAREHIFADVVLSSTSSLRCRSSTRLSPRDRVAQNEGAATQRTCPSYWNRVTFRGERHAGTRFKRFYSAK